MKIIVLILSSCFSKLFYNYQSPFFCRKDGSLAKKLSECLEPLSLSELWEPLCWTDGSYPGRPVGPIAIIFFHKIILCLVYLFLTKQRPDMISVVRVPQGLWPSFGLETVGRPKII